ncbi:MAG: type II secretion system protein N [Oxalobacteraceae bacterium]
MKRLPWFASFAMFIALCVSAAYWAMQLIQPPLRATAALPQLEQPEQSLDAAKDLFGGHAAATLASNYQLHGVVAAARSRDSVAILSADGKPAKAVVTGGELTPGVIVREVHPKYVLLSESGVIKRVELAVQSKGQTGLEQSLRAPEAAAPGTSSARQTTVVQGGTNGQPPPAQQGEPPDAQSQPPGKDIQR